ncbi:MAG: Gfo/Idh/MocA family oxidoreductase [Phycisphaerales bacterium]|nr:Gfo/Idh/MocA family oxidoreductase [Phycisphaerales bacterium]
MSEQNGQPDRRTMVKATAAAAGLAVVPSLLGRTAHAAGQETITVGLVGCGGRGTGAAFNAMEASPEARIVALADVFPDRLQGARNNLQKREQCTVTNDDCYVGFDAYQKLMARDDVDVVILATPPHFRPMHFAHAIGQGKHVFMEKPVAVDPAGVRIVMAASDEADSKNLSVAAGTQRRHEKCYLDVMERIRNGEIGEPVAARCYWNMGGLWNRGRQDNWSDMEWQMRNWLYFTWLSGDHIVEQHVHNLDATNWALGAHPIRCTGMGGRQARIDPSYGHIYDHFAIDYEYPNGVHALSMCRQGDGCSSRVEEAIQGTKGRAVTSSGRARLEGGPSWTFEGKNPNPYVVEHQDLHNSLRGQGNRLNEGHQIAESTLTAIMGRMAAYSGKDITWEDALNADLDMTPPQYAFVEIDIPEIPRPGRTAHDAELWVSDTPGA